MRSEAESESSVYRLAVTSICRSGSLAVSSVGHVGAEACERRRKRRRDFLERQAMRAQNFAQTSERLRRARID